MPIYLNPDEREILQLLSGFEKFTARWQVVQARYIDAAPDYVCKAVVSASFRALVKNMRARDLLRVRKGMLLANPAVIKEEILK